MHPQQDGEEYGKVERKGVAGEINPIPNCRMYTDLVSIYLYIFFNLPKFSYAGCMTRQRSLLKLQQLEHM